MSFNYAETERTRDTGPVSATDKPIARPDMIANNGGGFAFDTGLLKQLQRFLILGSSSPTYYTSAKTLTEANAGNIKQCIIEHPKETLDLILSISEEGRAPKQDPTLFAFALMFKYATPEWKFVASCQAHRILRTYTMLATFIKYLRNFHGWGKSIRRAVSNWYNYKTPDQVLYQFMKYSNREGWAHRDILHLAHVRPEEDDLKVLFNFIFGKIDESTLAKTFPAYGVDMELRAATTAKDVIKIIQSGESRVQWEQIPTIWLKSPEVWGALIPGMGLTALVRNLGRLTSLGVIGNTFSSFTKTVVNKLGSPDLLRKERVHPFSLLNAYQVYKSGRSEKGSLFWTPANTIKDVLESAYLHSANNIPPTGANIYIGVDCSGSMRSGSVCGSTMTPATAAGCLALELIKREKWVMAKGFSSTLFDLNISKSSTIAKAVEAVSSGPVSCTNPGLLIEDALERALPVDAFIMITDNEVNHGTHPYWLLKEYRRRTGIAAKLIVIGLTATNISLADPTDGGMLDIVGFDAGAHSVMHDFILGKV